MTTYIVTIYWPEDNEVFTIDAMDYEELFKKLIERGLIGAQSVEIEFY
jgi:hypothetical protein